MLHFNEMNPEIPGVDFGLNGLNGSRLPIFYFICMSLSIIVNIWYL